MCDDDTSTSSAAEAQAGHPDDIVLCEINGVNSQVTRLFCGEHNGKVVKVLSQGSQVEPTPQPPGTGPGTSDG